MKIDLMADAARNDYVNQTVFVKSDITISVVFISDYYYG